jgi:Arc/MetJ family transcription regulator
MRRTTVAVDDVAARSAQEELGTRTLSDTVNAALREIAARHARRRFIERMSAGRGSGVDDMRSAWR